MTIDDNLNFDLHIDKICLKSENQFNALVKLICSLGNQQRKETAAGLEPTTT